jgi:hypothetical protein
MFRNMKGQRFLDAAHRRKLFQIVVDFLIGRNIEQAIAG